MAIRLSSEQMDEILAHARADYPHECCGVLLGSAKGDDKTVTAVRRVDNTHEEGHERRFLISADAMYQVERDARQSGSSVLGFYHSHPDHPARPSGYDREWAWPWYSYIIVNVTRGEPGDLTCWTLEDEDAEFEAEEVAVIGGQ
jgi:proteasome lid subunit RPN8/RPN11